MVECTRCGGTQIVKSGFVRGKQRYLCKRCGFHFVEVDEREKSEAIVRKALCTVFHALGAKKCETIGRYLDRDASLIHRWMNETPGKYKRRWKSFAYESASINQVWEALKESKPEAGSPMLLIDNVIDDLYVAVILQRRKKR